MKPGVRYYLVPRIGDWGDIGYVLDGKYFERGKIEGEIVDGNFLYWGKAKGTVNGFTVSKDDGQLLDLLTEEQLDRS